MDAKTLFVVGWMGTVGVVATLCAEEPSSPPQDVPVRYLLTNADNVVVGQFVPAPGGLYLTRRGGRIFYPQEKIVILRDAISEIYDYKRSSVPAADLGERIKLSQWCLRNDLRDQARAELEGVLALDPSHAEANQRLRVIDGRDRRASLAESQTKTPAAAPVPPTPRQVLDHAISLMGKENFDRYNTLQKVLVNKCGGPACHGGSRYEGDFRLFHPRDGHSFDERLTARNVHSILKAMDMNDPNRSPLLWHAVNPHGRMPVAVMGGVNDPHYRELATWVSEVAQSYTGEPTVPANTPEPVPNPIPEMPLPAGRELFAADRFVTPDDSEIPIPLIRPRAPSMRPGDAPEPGLAGFTPVADDAPEDAPPRVPARMPTPPPTIEPPQQPRSETRAATVAIKKKPAANDPNDPSGFNQQSPPPEPNDSQPATEEP